MRHYTHLDDGLIYSSEHEMYYLRDERGAIVPEKVEDTWKTEGRDPNIMCFYILERYFYEFRR